MRGCAWLYIILGAWHLKSWPFWFTLFKYNPIQIVLKTMIWFHKTSFKKNRNILNKSYTFVNLLYFFFSELSYKYVFSFNVVNYIHLKRTQCLERTKYNIWCRYIQFDSICCLLFVMINIFRTITTIQNQIAGNRRLVQLWVVYWYIHEYI